jgi:hypothetical protein
MADKDGFSDSHRANEEEFFYKHDRELIEKARHQLEVETQRRQLGEAAGISDDNILRNLQKLGYNRENIALLNLAPLVDVAWSDGSLTAEERKLVLEEARQEGIAEGGPAWLQLALWLNDRPSEEFFHSTLGAIRTAIEALPLEEGERRKRDLLAGCTRIAAASGGVLGLGSKISGVERNVIARIAAELKYEAGHND